MAINIIAALRHQPQLRGNTFLIAVELAHRLNSSGYGRVSYHYLAWKAHCCRQTAITHIARLLELGLIRKTVIRTRAGYAWNHYQYIGPRTQTAAPPVTAHGQKGGSTLPDPGREKDTALRVDLERQKKALRLGLMTEGSNAWHKTCEEIARLEALLAPWEDAPNRAMTLFTSLGPSADCRGLTQVSKYQGRTNNAHLTAFSISQRGFSLSWGLQGKVGRTPHQSKGSGGTVWDAPCHT